MSILFRMARAAAFMFLMLSLITGMTGRAGAEEQEVKHVLANGLNIAYTEQGEGPAIVLIHGGGLTSAMWAKQIPALAKKYRVITPDTRGHGKTDNPSHRFGYSLLADDVAAFCKALDLKKPVLMGYSDGGIIALTVGIAYPELAGALVIGGAVPPSGQADLDHYFAGMKAFYAPVTKRSALTDDDLDAMYAASPEGWNFMAKMHAKPGQPDYWRTLMKDVWLTWNTP
ncbi:MAG TPA: alpha/beta hydrolase [Candidatus Mailhella merdavium]|nr:alpha/beta hydrolase [Candidatus Mailhella merdavium]